MHVAGDRACTALQHCGIVMALHRQVKQRRRAAALPPLFEHLTDGQGVFAYAAGCYHLQCSEAQFQSIKYPAAQQSSLQRASCSRFLTQQAYACAERRRCLEKQQGTMCLAACCRRCVGSCQGRLRHEQFVQHKAVAPAAAAAGVVNRFIATAYVT